VSFSLHHRVQNVSGAHTWVPVALSMGVKQPGREADHLHLVLRSKNEWNYTSTPPIHLRGVVLG
jgi:hypothetical protein